MTGKIFSWGDPFAISFEPTNRCNLRCPECPSGAGILTRKRGMADMQLFRDTLDQMHKHLFYLTLYFQGEPLINPEIFEMISYARRKGIFVATSTNGHFLNRHNCEAIIYSGLNKIIISVDGTTQETYEKYRAGGDLSKVLKGIRQLADIRKKELSRNPEIIVQFLVFRHNENQIAEIRKLGKNTGADKVEIKTAQLYDFRNGHEMMPVSDKYSRYRKISYDDGNAVFVTRNRQPDHCWRMWSSPVVTWEGDVVPCCYDKDASFVMGKISEKPFSEIWNGKAYNDFRRSIFTSRKDIAICSNCDQKW